MNVLHNFILSIVKGLQIQWCSANDLCSVTRGSFTHFSISGLCGLDGGKLGGILTENNRLLIVLQHLCSENVLHIVCATKWPCALQRRTVLQLLCSASNSYSVTPGLCNMVCTPWALKNVLQLKCSANYSCSGTPGLIYPFLELSLLWKNVWILV